MTEEEKKKKEQANMTSPKTFDIRQDEVSETPRPVVDAVSAAAIKAAPVANRPQTLDEAMSMAHNNMNAALEESMAAEDKANAEQLQADAARASLYPAGVYDSIFGPERTETEKTELEKLDEARRQTYQEMIENRKKALQKQQTADYRLASFNALGNALRTMVQPVGWAAGGSTAGVQPYDERQYLESFNRAAKATDDLRNLGMLEDQFKYKLADEDYQTKLAIETARAKEQRELAAYKAKADIDLANKIKLANNKYDLDKMLTEVKAAYKITDKSTKLSVKDRVLLKQLQGYQENENRREALGLPSRTFPEYLKEKGMVDVEPIKPNNSESAGLKSGATENAGLKNK